MNTSRPMIRSRGFDREHCRSIMSVGHASDGRCDGWAGRQACRADESKDGPSAGQMDGCTDTDMQTESAPVAKQTQEACVHGVGSSKGVRSSHVRGWRRRSWAHRSTGHLLMIRAAARRLFSPSQTIHAQLQTCQKELHFGNNQLLVLEKAILGNRFFSAKTTGSMVQPLPLRCTRLRHNRSIANTLIVCSSLSLHVSSPASFR